MKTVITDVHTRKAFDIVNILKTKGIELSLVSDKSFLHRFLLSVIYLQAVKKNINQNFTVLPTEDKTISEIIDKKYNFKLPSKKSFDIALNKEKFGNFCKKHSFDTPKIFSYQEVLDMESFLPLIIKPKVGSGALGIRYIDTKEEFINLDLDFEKFIIQERLKETKEVEGAFFLFDKGEILSFYSHKRIKTYPKNGGVTIYSVSTCNHDIKDTGEKLLKKLEWSGFAMIEFIKDKDSYKIIELNPRVWGSIMLSEFCNSNMLENYVRICQDKKPLDSTVKTGKKIRWLIPWDIAYLLKNFYRLDRKDTCYINFTYAAFYSAVLFLFYNTLNPLMIKKLFKKILS